MAAPGPADSERKKKKKKKKREEKKKKKRKEEENVEEMGLGRTKEWSLRQLPPRR